MTTAGCLPDLLTAEEPWIHHLPQKMGQLRAHIPFQSAQAISPSFPKGHQFSPASSKAGGAEPGAWGSFLAAEETGSVVTSVVSALLKESANQGSFECPQPDFLSFEKATQWTPADTEFTTQRVLQVVFPILSSHINSGEAWIWHWSVVLSLEWVHSSQHRERTEQFGNKKPVRHEMLLNCMSKTTSPQHLPHTHLHAKAKSVAQGLVKHWYTGMYLAREEKSPLLLNRF